MTVGEIAYSDIDDAVAAVHLDILGVATPIGTDPVPDGTKSIVLLGPKEPGFWSYIQKHADFSGRSPDPIDSWSHRVVTALGEKLGGTPVFPFGGSTYAPFVAWALRSGRCWTSPVSLLVHDQAGLFVSFRGALCFSHQLAAPSPAESPCLDCPMPCLHACPVGALDGGSYDLDRCHGFLDTSPGTDCMDNGCAARRSCPISQSYGRIGEQSAHHMKAFHK